MEKINISQERVDLLALIKQVERSQQSVMLETDDGTRVSLRPATNPKKRIEGLVDEMVAFRERANISLPEGMTIKDLVEEGRRY